MKQGYTKSRKKRADNQTEEDFRWFSTRRYLRLVTVCEVFLRWVVGKRR